MEKGKGSIVHSPQFKVGRGPGVPKKEKNDEIIAIIAIIEIIGNL